MFFFLLEGQGPSGTQRGRAYLSWAKPSGAKPCRAEVSLAQPSRAELTQAVPGQANRDLIWAGPTPEPSLAELGRAELV